MKNIITLLAALLLSGIIGLSCAPVTANQSPYSPEEWEQRMDEFFEDMVRALS